MDRDGVEGLFDVFLFLTILSVSSCIILTSVPMLIRSEDFERGDAAIRYAEDNLEAILSSTLPNASYQEHDGGDVRLENDSTVKEFLLDETYLVWTGWPQSSFAACNIRIEMTLGHLIAPAYRFSLVTSVDGGDGYREVVALGDSGAPIGFSASRQYWVGGVAATLSLTLWWA